MLGGGAADRDQRGTEHIVLVARAVEISDLDQARQQGVAGGAAELQGAHQVRQGEGLPRMIGDEVEDGGHAADAGRGT